MSLKFGQRPKALVSPGWLVVDPSCGRRLGRPIPWWGGWRGTGQIHATARPLTHNYYNDGSTVGIGLQPKTLQFVKRATE